MNHSFSLKCWSQTSFYSYLEYSCLLFVFCLVVQILVEAESVQLPGLDKAKSLIGQISSFSKLLLLSCIWALSFSFTNDDVLSPIVLWRIHLQKWLRIILNLNFRNDFNIYQSCTMKFYIYITCKLPKARFKDITRFFYQLKNTRFGLECHFLKKI